MKRANKIGGSIAESVERRASAERNLGIHAMAGLRRPAELDAGLAWVHEAAAGNRALRFDNLLHHVTMSRLEQAYRALRKDAAAGVDEEHWEAYGVGLSTRLVQLHEAVQSGRYRPQPVLRQWAQKPDGRKRPLGVSCVEDKVNLGVGFQLNDRYSLSFSYGRTLRVEFGHDIKHALGMGIVRSF